MKLLISRIILIPLFIIGLPFCLIDLVFKNRLTNKALFVITRCIGCVNYWGHK